MQVAKCFWYWWQPLALCHVDRHVRQCVMFMRQSLTVIPCCLLRTWCCSTAPGSASSAVTSRSWPTTSRHSSPTSSPPCRACSTESTTRYVHGAPLLAPDSHPAHALSRPHPVPPLLIRPPPSALHDANFCTIMYPYVYVDRNVLHVDFSLCASYKETLKIYCVRGFSIYFRFCHLRQTKIYM